MCYFDVLTGCEGQRPLLITRVDPEEQMQQVNMYQKTFCQSLAFALNVKDFI